MKFSITSSYFTFLLATLLSSTGHAFVPSAVPHTRNTLSTSTTRLFSSTPTTPPQQQQQQQLEYELEFLKPAETTTDQWELDCYSRPVIQPGGKKLWEVLICDSGNTFRYKQELPSSQVNSKTLRQVVEQCVELVPSSKPPSVIRFFRGAMFNMMNVALKELPDVTAKPSRCTFALATWLEERHANVYPNMEGYNAQMTSSNAGASFLNVQTPVKLPDSLRGERYAFVSLPLAEFLPGGGVNSDTIGVGRLCPLPPALMATPAAGDTFVSGVVLLTPRAKAMATWLAGTELMSLKADLRKRQLIMETDLDTQYLMARLNDEQRAEGAALEQAKDQLQGLHFVSVQVDEESDPEGFWLLRELPSNI